jgi:hypothetical protein
MPATENLDNNRPNSTGDSAGEPVPNETHPCDRASGSRNGLFVVTGKVWSVLWRMGRCRSDGRVGYLSKVNSRTAVPVARPGRRVRSTPDS